MHASKTQIGKVIYLLQKLRMGKVISIEYGYKIVPEAKVFDGVEQALGFESERLAGAEEHKTLVRNVKIKFGAFVCYEVNRQVFVRLLEEGFD